MASSRFGAVARQLTRIFGSGTVAGLAEGQLLERFVTRSDESAFEALVARHGPMVLGVCRRHLDDPNDVDDAFQATFLILVKKARSIRDPERLGPWLHGVARRVALRARARTAHRHSREQGGAEEAALIQPESGDHRELRSVLDEEIGRLPSKYRDPIVLCYLEGCTHEEAAHRLRCPVGTIRSRLAWARDKLRARLTRRGLASPAGLAGALVVPELTRATVPDELIRSTVRAAVQFAAGGAPTAGLVSAGVATLTEGVLHAMFLHKLKMMALAGLSLTMLIGGAGVVARQSGGDSSKPAPGGTSEIKQEVKAEPGQELPRAPDERDRIVGGDLINESFAQVQKQLDASKATEEDLKKQIADLRKEVNALKAARKPNPAGSPPQAEYFKPPAGGFGAPGGQGFAGGMGGMGPMMGGGMMGGLRQRRPEVPTVQTDLIVAVADPQKKKVPAYSAETGRWVTYEAPEGVTVIPIVANDIMALQANGAEIHEVAVFNGKDGAWYPQKLREPVKDRVIPMISQDVAVFPAGRYCYAYSVPAGRWDVLELEKGAEAKPSINRTITSVEHAGHLYLFSHKLGKWEDFDSKSK